MTNPRHSNANPVGRWLSAGAVALILLAFFAQGRPQSRVFSSLTEIRPPVAQGAREPALFAGTDGALRMSWVEPVGKAFAVKTATRSAHGWNRPKTAVRSNDLFVNWADFPSVAAFDDGTLAVHWLRKNGPSSYDYDVNIALSSDVGRSWGTAIVPHRDGMQRQHGFATLLPLADNRLIVLWLDGRAYDENAADTFTNASQLRTSTLSADGKLSDDVLLDVRTCTCCQTSAVVTGSGIVLVAYRDRTAGEIRDISVVRLQDGTWSQPATVHHDGWEISGCPVNGPAIDAHGKFSVVAWFTAAQDIPAVKLAFSENDGATFAPALVIDTDTARGRVDVVQLGDGSALVSWVSESKGGESLVVCRAFPKTGCSKSQVITRNDAGGLINFPRMVAVGDSIFIAWTQPLPKQSSAPEFSTTIRMVEARF